MSDQKYIVLRTEPSFVPDVGAMGAGGPVASARDIALMTGLQKVELSEVALSKAQKDDLRRDPRTRAIALPMPLRLIEPEADNLPATPTATNVTWGVEAVGANSSSFDGNGVTVAVLDTGIDPGHAAFAGVNIVQKNFTQEGDDDNHGHGTHCAGTIFGREVDNQRIGVAPGVNKALIGKVLGTGGGSSATLASAMNWAADEGAHVISMSLGIDFPGFVDFLVNDNNLEIEPATSIALEQYRANVNLFNQLAALLEARNAFAQGTIVLAASGNESNRPTYEIAVAPPAAGTGIISVGAL
jgi:subtilisin family serine protease